MSQVFYNFFRNRFAGSGGIDRNAAALVENRFPHTRPNAFEPVINEVQKAVTFVGQIVPTANMQIIEKVKQIIPASNTGADRLIQLLFGWGGTGHRTGVKTIE
jgi:hypothetical protein